MTKRSIQVDQIAYLNKCSVSKKDEFEFIKYLDTANITRNRIAELQEFELKRDKIPSRAKRKVKKNTIVYSTVRPNQEHYGFLEDPDDNLVVSTGFTTIDVHDSDVSSKYLYYLLSQKQIRDFLHGIGINSTSSYPSIRPEDIGNLKFEIPADISDQQRISALLSVLDSKIELNNKINAELEQMAETLYDYWFVQFDFPNKNDKPYKSSGGEMVWSEELKREIPKDWSAVPISKLLATSKNGDWGEDFQDDGLMQVYCIRGADINALNGRASTFEPPVRFVRNDHDDRLLKPDDLVVEISGGSPTQSTGRIAHVGNEVFARFETPIVCSNFCKAISFKEKTQSYVVKHYWSKLYEAGIFFNFEGKTSGIKNLMFDQLIKDVHVALPDDNKLVGDFYRLSVKIDEMIQSNLLQTKELAELRDWLLPMLMNGQVTVK